MRTLLFYFLSIMCTSAFIGCGSNDVNNPEVDSLRIVLNEKLSELNDMGLFLDVVNVSMDSVIKMENEILRTNNESPLSQKEQIKQNLEAYKLILKRQHERIFELEEKLKDNSKNEKMLATIKMLKAQLAEKDQTIMEMAEELEKRKFDIESLKKNVRKLTNDVAELTDANKAQEEILVAQSDMLNEGYVYIGSKSELKKAGILSGGSILKKSKLDISNINTSAFTKIDIRNTKTFKIPSKKAEVVTQMPKSSYSIKQNSDGTSTLTVKDAAAFWSVSKYLVIKY